MSRLLISCSLVAAFTSSAFADRALPRFAQPPPNISASSSAPALPVRDIAPLVDRAEVRAKLAAQRTASLAFFRVYQRKGLFPSNVYAGSKRNVWVDPDGNYCAAATIIQLSGQRDLVARVGEQTNFIKLADVEQGPLMDWILTSGLTQAEIAAIQEPFMPVGDEPGRGRASEAPINLTKRTAEDRRLAKKYLQVDAQIVKHRERSLDRATDRLMQRPDLAARLLGQ
ncbi:MAG: hypothetical protein WKG01_25680 [Kofleriaceae bacterium]